jgi:hypothetical protein
MRPSRTVARAALTAALAIGALPGLVGSYQPSPDQAIDAAAYRQVNLATTRDQQSLGAILLDAAGRSEGALDPSSEFGEVGDVAPAPPDERAQPALPAAQSVSSWRQPRYTITGSASFYDNGTTAMRIPRGTTVVICGGGGCIERKINDYGPAAYTGRIVDMYRPDFFRICGCGWWSGTTTVTIKVY